MEIIIRKSHLFWDGDNYKYGGFGKIITKCSSFSEAENLLDNLTIDFLRNDNPKINDYIFSNNDSSKDAELIQNISSFFAEEFELDFETDFWLPQKATDKQVLELSKLFSFPFFSIVKKENDVFYINELNDKFWSEEEILEFKSSSWNFTRIDWGVKHVYNDYESAKLDGTKKMLSNVIRGNDLFIKLKTLKELQFVNEWHNEIDHYTEILPNNSQSKRTIEVIERIKSIINLEEIFICKEITFAEATLFEDVM